MDIKRVHLRIAQNDLFGIYLKSHFYGYKTKILPAIFVHCIHACKEVTATDFQKCLSPQLKPLSQKK